MTGRVLGEFQVGARIGSGGFGEVYQARQLSLGRDAVIKVLRADGGGDPAGVARFEREAHLASQLDHPYAAHIYAFGSEPDGLLWIAMELVRGTTLRERIRERGPIPLTRFVPLFERLCEVVHTAHAADLVHRDIKPENVMVISRAGRLLPKLLDFGIAKALGAVAEPERPPAPRSPRAKRPTMDEIDDGWALGAAADEPDADEPAAAEPDADDEVDQVATMTPAGAATMAATEESPAGLTGAALGTPAYMAPEQWAAPAEVDYRADIYALGVLAYDCLTGTLPFAGQTWRDFLLAHATAPIPSLGAGFPEELDEVIARALAKDPDDRYESALDFAEALRRTAGLGGDVAIPRLAGDVARRFVLAGPPPLAQAVAMFDSARSVVEARLVLQRLLGAIPPWLGVVALAARLSPEGAGAGDLEPGLIAKLRRESLGGAEWLALVESAVGDLGDDPELFGVPELVEWATGPDRERLEQLIEAGPGDLGSAARLAADAEVISAVLRSLEFLADYPVTVGSDRLAGVAAGRETAAFADVGEVALSDADGIELFRLSPLVVYAAPAPGERPALFVAAGRGRDGVRMVADPHGFERDDAELESFLAARFGELSIARSTSRDDRPPYRGLAPFTSDDADLFFGRDRVVEMLRNRMLVNPLLVVTGPSGSGKSSLLSAGLIPRLADRWEVVTLRPGRSPMTALEAALARIGAGDLGELVDRIASRGSRLLIAVDQGEELFTAADPDEAAELAAALAGHLAGDTVRIVVTLRDDYLGQLDALAAWRPLLGSNIFVVTSPNRDELSRIVVEPAARLGYRFDDGVVDDLIDEVADHPGALPLLSFAAARLWDDRDAGARTMTRAAYQAMGGVGGALANYADSVVDAVASRERAMVQRLFGNLVTAEGTRAVLSRGELAELVPDSESVLAQLIESRLLVSSEGEEGERVEIIHEALIERWPRLARWHRQDADAVQLRDELRSAARRWRDRSRASSYLWRGEALETYRRWRERWTEPLTHTEDAFVRASVAAETRGRRIRRGLIAAAVLFLSAAVVVLVFANLRANRSERRAAASAEAAEERLTELLADRGRRELLEGSRLRGLIYLAEAYKRGADSPGFRVSLRFASRSLDRQMQSLMHGDGAVGWILQTADNSVIATSDGAGKAKLWTWTAGGLTPLHELEHPPEQEVYIAMSERFRRVATVSWADGKLRVFDFDGALVASSDTKTMVRSFVANPARPQVGSTYVNRAAIWDLETARLQGATPPLEKAQVEAVAFSPDGERFAAGATDGKVRIWGTDDITGEPLLVCGGQAPVVALHFASDSERVLMGSADGTLWICGLDGSTRSIRAHGGPFDLTERDGQLATCGIDKRAKLWDLARGVEIASLPHRGPVLRCELSRDGRWLATSASSGVYLWDARRGLRLATFEGHTADVVPIAFVGDDYLISGALDGELRTWRISDLNLLLSGHAAPVLGVAFSPEGDRVASIGDDQVARVWPASGGEPRVLDTGPAMGIGRVAFSPDGKRLITAGYEAAGVWDPSTGAKIRAVEATMGADLVDSDRAVIANADGEVALVSAEGKKTALATGDRPFCVRVSPGGDRVGLGRLGSVAVVDLADNKIRWQAPAKQAYSVDWSGDGSLLAAVDVSGFLTLFDAETGEVRRRIKQPVGSALSVALSPDGTLAASGAVDENIYVWETDSGRLVAKLSGHRGIVWGVDFSPDGRRLVSGAADGAVMIWDLAPETRSPSEIEALVESKARLRLDGVDLVVKP